MFRRDAFISGQRGAFSATRLISAAAQSRPWSARRAGTIWSARRDGVAHCARQKGHRYRVRRRAIDSGPFLSLVTGKACHSWSALRT